MKRHGRKAVHERDQGTSPFGVILADLVLSVMGAIAAVLVDEEGETVDYAGDMDPFELKLTAAHWQLVARELKEGGHPGVSTMHTLRVHSGIRSHVLWGMDQGYIVVLVMHRHAAFSVSGRAISVANRRLRQEAGFAPLKGGWFPVDVKTHEGKRDRKRPFQLKVQDEWQPVVVLGTMANLGDGETGFCVRLPSGVELLIVRERSGRWFTEMANVVMGKMGEMAR